MTAVIDGFTVGIAVIIAASQLKDVLGLEIASLPADFAPKMVAIVAARETASLAAAGVGVATAIPIVIIRRLAPAFPGPIVAVAVTSGAVALLELPVATIASSFGDLPSSLPRPAFPPVSPERLAELLPSAIVIAFLAGVESLLSAMVADRMIGGQHPELTIARALLSAAGNTLRFEQQNPGWIWGVTDLLLTEHGDGTQRLPTI